MYSICFTRARTERVSSSVSDITTRVLPIWKYHVPGLLKYFCRIFFLPSTTRWFFFRLCTLARSICGIWAVTVPLIERQPRVGSSQHLPLRKSRLKAMLRYVRQEPVPKFNWIPSQFRRLFINLESKLLSFDLWYIQNNSQQLKRKEGVPYFAFWNVDWQSIVVLF